jgi:hypothetical protein
MHLGYGEVSGKDCNIYQTSMVLRDRSPLAVSSIRKMKRIITYMFNGAEDIITCT